MPRRAQQAIVEPPPVPEAPRVRWLVIDPSSEPHKIGWAFFEQGVLTRCGTLPRLRGKHPAMERFEHIVRHADHLIQDTKPDWMLIEDQFLGRNPKTLRILTAAKTLWITLAFYHTIPVTEVHPTEWQRTFQGTWRLGITHDQMMRTVRAIIQAHYPSLPQDLDENTLCAIGIGFAKAKSPTPIPVGPPVPEHQAVKPPSRRRLKKVPATQP